MWNPKRSSSKRCHKLFLNPQLTFQGRSWLLRGVFPNLIFGARRISLRSVFRFYVRNETIFSVFVCFSWSIVTADGFLSRFLTNRRRSWRFDTFFSINERLWPQGTSVVGPSRKFAVSTLTCIPTLYVGSDRDDFIVILRGEKYEFGFIIAKTEYETFVRSSNM